MAVGLWIFGFKQAFADAVASGAKRQTIRAERKDRRRPCNGQAVRCYAGLRTAACRRLRDGEVVRVASVVIGHRLIEIDGQPLPEAEWVAFARADGFADVAAFFDFFGVEHGGSFFRGFLTVWA